MTLDEKSVLGICFLQDGFLNGSPLKYNKVSDYIVNPIKKVLSVRIS